MSDNEDIRRALADLAGNPAPRDLKPGVHQRVARLHRRRQGTTAVTLSVVTLVAGLTLTRIPALHHQDPAAQSVAGASTDAASSSAGATSKPPKATKRGSKPTLAVVVPTAPTRGNPPLTTHRPGTSTDTGQAPASTPSTGGTTGGTSSGAPKTKTPSLAAGSKSSPTPSGSAGPDLAKETLTATLSAVTDVDGSNAPYSTLTLRVQGQIYGSLDDVDMGYRPTGGRSGIHRENKSAGPCTVQTGQLHDVDQSLSFRYRFRLASTYTPSATITTWDHNCTYGVARRVWTVFPSVTIATGSPLANGAEPIVINVSAKVQGSSIVLGIAGDDPDGYIRSSTVDWGAGAPPIELGGDTHDCDDSGGRYWPDSWTRSTATSPVLAAGTYTVTATVTSTGCDGKDSQSATKQVTVVVP